MGDHAKKHQGTNTRVLTSIVHAEDNPKQKAQQSAGCAPEFMLIVLIIANLMRTQVSDTG